MLVGIVNSTVLALKAESITGSVLGEILRLKTEFLLNHSFVFSNQGEALE